MYLLQFGKILCFLVLFFKHRKVKETHTNVAWREEEEKEASLCVLENYRKYLPVLLCRAHYSRVALTTISIAALATTPDIGSITAAIFIHGGSSLCFSNITTNLSSGLDIHAILEIFSLYTCLSTGATCRIGLLVDL